MSIVVINGVIATKADKQELSRAINEDNIDFEVYVSKSGIQYVETFN